MQYWQKKLWFLIRKRQFKLLITRSIKFFSKGNTRDLLALYEQNVVANYLVKKYNRLLGIGQYIGQDFVSVSMKPNSVVWFCWLQGIDNAPELVQRCYQSLVLHNPNKEVILIDDTNMFEYVTFPEFILEKWQSGVISNTHFSDLLRLELLVTHGGIWSDATVYYTDSIPDYITDNDLFVFTSWQHGTGNISKLSNWFICANCDNFLLKKTRDVLYEYWKEHEGVVHYYVFHLIFSLVSQKNLEYWKRVYTISNVPPHVLQFCLFDEYSEDKFEVIKKNTFLHKLSYKFSDELLNKEGTFYESILNLD